MVFLHSRTVPGTEGRGARELRKWPFLAHLPVKERENMYLGFALPKFGGLSNPLIVVSVEDYVRNSGKWSPLFR